MSYQQNQQHGAKKVQQQHNQMPQNSQAKRSDDDQDTLSLDSEKSQGFINQPLNSWPAWSVDNQNPMRPKMRYPVNSYNQVPTQPNFPPQFITRGPVFSRPNFEQVPVYYP